MATVEERDKMGLPRTKSCTSQAHFAKSSPYPRDNIPIEEFIKELGAGRIQICDTCSFCRNKRTGARNRKINERKEEHVQVQAVDPNFGVCVSECHGVEGVSKYPRNKVPSELFLGRTKEKTYPHCLDCRTHINKISENAANNRKLSAQPDEYVCRCGKRGGMELRAVNLDGTPASRCIHCKEAEINFNALYRENRKEVFRLVKLEMMKKSGCSCQRCKSIFIRSLDKTKPFIELKTVLEDGIRYVTYSSQKYISTDFIEKFQAILEFRMFDFDHLTEEEQRERGIIQPHEAFIEKRGSVTEMKTAWDIKEEAKITQNLCCLCHLIVTLERQGQTRAMRAKTKAKADYVNNWKREKMGCEMCKFFDPNLLRYLECDHIDVNEKIDTICNMVYNDKYTLEDIIEECRKCRLLCRICHRIHTHNQIKEGLFEDAHRDYPIY